MTISLRVLKIENADGSLMAFICTAMPEDMKKLLFPQLIASLGGLENIVDRDESSTGEESFQCVHFSWYNRYTIQVSELSYLSHFSALTLVAGRCCA